MPQTLAKLHQDALHLALVRGEGGEKALRRPAPPRGCASHAACGTSLGSANRRRLAPVWPSGGSRGPRFSTRRPLTALSLAQPAPPRRGPSLSVLTPDTACRLFAAPCPFPLACHPAIRARVRSSHGLHPLSDTSGLEAQSCAPEGYPWFFSSVLSSRPKILVRAWKIGSARYGFPCGKITAKLLQLVVSPCEGVLAEQQVVRGPGRLGGLHDRCGRADGISRLPA